MQQKLVPIVFSFFILLFSSVSYAGPKLYALIASKHNQQTYTSLFVFDIGDNGQPQSVIIDHMIDSMYPTAISIKQESNLMFIASSIYHTVFICRLDTQNGDLRVCAPASIFLQYPMGMTFFDNRFYVTDKVTGNVLTCTIEDMDLTNCHNAISNVMDPSQVALLPASTNAYILQPSLSGVSQCATNYLNNTFYNCMAYAISVPNRGPIYPIAMGIGAISFINFSAGFYLLDGAYSDKNAISCRISSGTPFNISTCNFSSLPGGQPGTAMVMLNRQDGNNRDLAIISNSQQIYSCSLLPQQPFICRILVNIKDYYQPSSYIYGVSYKF